MDEMRDFVTRIVPVTEIHFVTPAGVTPWWLSGAVVDLDFAHSRYYSLSDGGIVTAGTQISCSRASGWYAKTSTGALSQFSNNEPRITDLGLLVEGARNNATKASQEISGSPWLFFNTAVTSTHETAPDGTYSMDQEQEDNNNSAHSVFQNNIVCNTTSTYTASVFGHVHTTDRKWLGIVIDGGNTEGTAFWAIFDLIGGTLTDSGVNTPAAGTTLVGANIESYLNPQHSPILTYRIALTFIYGGTATGVTSQTIAMSAGPLLADTTYQGTGLWTNIWGAMLEETTSPIIRPTTYVPTTTSVPVSRAADVISIIGAAQTNIASATGTIVVEVGNGLATGYASNIVDSNGTNLLGFNATDNAVASLVAPLTTANTANRTTTDKIGLSWSAAGRSLVLNGGAVATDANAQTPSATQHIGSTGLANFAYAYVKRLTVWNTRLDDATLQGFTT